MSVLDTFVAFRLETTGLGPQSGEIIGLDAVRVRGGKVAGRFSRLVRPQRRVPAAVARRTGIGAEQVEGALPIQDQLPAFSHFLGDDPVVAHDAAAQGAFLEQHGPLPDPLYDSLELARVALPRLINHKLETLAGYLGIALRGRRTPPQGARTTAEVFLALVDLLRQKGLPVLQQLVLLSDSSDSNLHELFSNLALELSKGALGRKIRAPRTDPHYLRALFNIGGTDEPGVPPPHTVRPLDIARTASLFEEGGPLEQHLADYELREPQVKMTQAVCRAFNQSAFLLVEAGTGTGKSMAYLIPAVLWAVQNRRRVVISTNTKNLQEQLFYKDIPELETALGCSFLSVLLKGRANYLCLSRWRTALTQPQHTFTPQERKAALPLVVWCDETQTGDVAENSGFHRGRHAGLWAKLCSEPGTCLKQKCKFRDTCFLVSIRRKAMGAHLVVVNHSLLFSDLASDNAVLGDYVHLILDEAHNVEKVATQYLGKEFSIWRMKNLVNRLYSKDVVEIGTLVLLSQHISQAKTDAPFAVQIALLVRLTQTLWRDGQHLFEAMGRLMTERFGDESPFTQKVRHKAQERVFEPLAAQIGDFSAQLAALAAELGKLTEWLRELPDGSFPMQDESMAGLEGAIVDASAITADLAFLTQAQDEGYVYWLERPSRDRASDVRLYAAPLDISQHLSNALYGRLDTMILTSATLAVGGRFDYLLGRLGLDREHGERVQTLAVGSPFSYQDQVLVGVGTFVPSPKSGAFPGAVSEIILSLTTQTRRGTLVLFTAYDMLNGSYDALKDRLQTEGIQLLGQGRDGSRSRIIDQFREDASSVLLGTDSFWEGIDVAGASLQMLILVKLPFAVPTEPIVAAQMELLEKAGKNPFTHYTVPEAVIKFRQGFGRLIRNKSDYGVVVILDHRVLRSSYGPAFLSALPVQVQPFPSQEAMVADIKQWFGGAA